MMLAFSGEYPDIMYNEMDNGLPGTQYIQNVAAPTYEWSNYWSNEGTQPDDYSLADPTAAPSTASFA